MVILKAKFSLIYKYLLLLSISILKSTDDSYRSTVYNFVIGNVLPQWYLKSDLHFVRNIWSHLQFLSRHRCIFSVRLLLFATLCFSYIPDFLCLCAFLSMARRWRVKGKRKSKVCSPLSINLSFTTASKINSRIKAAVVVRPMSSYLAFYNETLHSTRSFKLLIYCTPKFYFRRSLSFFSFLLLIHYYIITVCLDRYLLSKINIKIFIIYQPQIFFITSKELSLLATCSCWLETISLIKNSVQSKLGNI